MTKIGQKTGTLKHSKNVENIATNVDITVCSLEIIESRFCPKYIVIKLNHRKLTKI